MCEPGTLAQNDSAKVSFKPATEWTDSKENFEPVCNGENRGECATGTLAQGDTYGANKTHRNEYARSKKEETKETRIIESSINPNDWKVEVEKVAPLLKMRLEQDNKEWRTHLEHTMELQAAIQEKVHLCMCVCE